jgi:hypothetical protein
MSTGIVPISGTRGPAYTGSSVTFSVVDATNTQQATGNCTEYPAGSGIYIANPTINSAWLPARAFMTIGGVLGVQDIAELPGQSSGGGLTAQQTRDALELAATTGAASIDAQLAGLATALSGGGSGNGPYTVTQLVTDGTNPLQGASVGLAANNATLTAATNSDGIATFALSAYAYGRAATLQGYQFTPDTTATIGASGALPTLVMGAVVIPTFDQPGQVRAYFPVFNGQGYYAAASQVVFAVQAAPAGDTNYGGYDLTVICAINAATGQPINPNNHDDVADGCVLLADTTYTVQVDGGATANFTTGASGNYIIPLKVLGGV